MNLPAIRRWLCAAAIALTVVAATLVYPAKVQRVEHDARSYWAPSCYNSNKRTGRMPCIMQWFRVVRVEHVTVYGRDGTKLGTIERLMLDKVSGMVAYAVIKPDGRL